MSDVKPLFDAAKWIRQLVASYCSNERHSERPPFVVHGPYIPGEIWGAGTSNGPGCYVIYGEDKSVRYIGMSMESVGNRIASHLSPATQRSSFWANGSPPALVDIIAVGHGWEAPSLEAYLYAAPQSPANGT
jgi:hypothetical protein